ncbi:Ribosome-recycling factor [Candidatus Arsenophonus lipoptenae]|uniref:Ribosome-recycling factor n=1 Tax=Candidatus Arsenophonus lipoptenae TaxID=634113 RepID=A0A109QDZ0_9GAMM|nr:ribosome recycling factor [Candidatus Arsenophonus lipoptenae]AMA64620.1 Ribosome-recycling factor [Candidatus Arsenophonus lipoptenae]
MITAIKQYTQESMEKDIEAFKNQINKMRTNRASPNLLYGLMIKCYGSTKKLHQLANIITEDSRTLAITVFDPTLVPAVEKAIMSSCLGLNPFSKRSLIRVSFPPLTEERRKNLIKILHNDAEKRRISIRRLRRDANIKLKILLKNKEISEDNERCAQDEIQKLTNNFIKIIGHISEEKEKELMIF